MPALDEGARLTSSLNEARNDTGRIAFCGPIVLSAITGYSVSKMEDEIRAFRDLAPERKPVVKGTHAEEVAAALAHFGYNMDLKESYMRLSRKERPSRLDLDAEAAQRLGALHPRHPQGQGGPLGADQGREAVRHLLGGALAVRVRRPPQGRRIMEVFEVRKALGSIGRNPILSSSASDRASRASCRRTG